MAAAVDLGIDEGIVYPAADGIASMLGHNLRADTEPVTMVRAVVVGVPRGS